MALYKRLRREITLQVNRQINVNPLASIANTVNEKEAAQHF